MSIEERIKAIAGCALALLLITGSLGIKDSDVQIAIAVFGMTYGGLWLQDIEWR